MYKVFTVVLKRTVCFSRSQCTFSICYDWSSASVFQRPYAVVILVRWWRRSLYYLVVRQWRCSLHSLVVTGCLPIAVWLGRLVETEGLRLDSPVDSGKLSLCTLRSRRCRRQGYWNAPGACRWGVPPYSDVPRVQQISRRPGQRSVVKIDGGESPG